MNYYERHLGDYARDTGHLTMVEHGAYSLLLDRYYATERGIPFDQAHRIARARSDEERTAVDNVLSEFFVLEAGCWVHRRVEQELQKARGRIDAARENGRRGGRPRKPAGNQEETQQKPTGFPLGSENETQQKPRQKLTNHQTPVTKQEQKQEPVAPSAARSEPALDPATGRPLTIPLNTGGEHPVTEDELGEYRRLFPAVDLPRELLLARRWCLDNPTKRKTARGVRAFLTRWLERAQDRAPGRLLQPVHGGSREAARPLSAVDRVNEAVARRRAERGEQFPADFGFDNGRVVAEQ